MKDITVFENFLTDEELKESQQFLDDSAFLHPIRPNEFFTSRWMFSEIDNCYKKIVVDERPDSYPKFEFSELTPSARIFISKMKDKIENYTSTNFDLQRVYINRQKYGENVPLHIDDLNPCAYTFLIYMGDITPENFDKTGGVLEFNNKENTRIEPFTRRAVLFRGDIPHRVFAPVIPDITRISFAFKFLDTSKDFPFIVSYT